MTRKHHLLIAFAALLAASLALQTAARPPQAAAWTFAVSGDSRNCGDVVMPTIAAHALTKKPAFYWHLGDLRALYKIDEDVAAQPDYKQRPLTITGYYAMAWPDFIQNQIVPFGSTPFILGIGNHELVLNKTREEFIAQFADWLNAPPIQQQRLKDDPKDHRVRAYYHWVKGGLDFINLDNASDDQFDPAQVRWFEGVARRIAADATITTVVVGMHKALPESISADHSMNQSPQGVESGRRVYKALLNLRDKSNKKVYVLASHSHYYMEGIFNTDYWKQNGGVLPGWIVGTAGAERYPLPPDAKSAAAAMTNVYGYLLGTVQPNGEITFAYQRVTEADTPATVRTRYGDEFIHWCHAENSQAKQP